MAFPTIPTVAAGRVLFSNQANATSPRTFPNLSSLTKNSGDLLIAIIVCYETNLTSAIFSSWGAGFTEFVDTSAGASTIAIGCAYKWSDGTETGTFTVAQAGTITGHASMVLLSIPGAHASTPPVAGTFGYSTSTAGNPASLNPTAWDIEDTLWIAVGASGMTSATSTWTGLASAPTNYTDYADSATVDNSIIGQTEVAVAFRQIAAAAEDAAGFSVDTSNARNLAFVIAVRPAPTPKSTSVARVSLESHGTPSARTDHIIKIRARTTTGSTGVIKAALYEGSTNRSGDLTSGFLTNTLADYTLVIPDASAANIIDYSNLEIRFWGYDNAGNALIFEVSDVYVELPLHTPETFYGIVARPITFTKAVSGVIQPQTTAVAEISLASHGTPSARTNHSIKIRARTTSGSTGVIKAALYEGATNRSGDLISGTLTNSLADYTLVIPDASAANITDYSNLSLKIWGYAPNGGSLVFEVAKVHLELPAATGGPTTYYGVVSAPFTFVKAVAGIIQAFKQTSVAEISLASHGTPSARTNHSIKIRARTTSGSTGVIKAALYEGATNRSGDLTSSLLTNTLADYTLVIPNASAAAITSYSDLTLKIWGYDSTGAALVFEVAKVHLELPVGTSTTYYGVIAAPFTFTKAVSGTKKTFGQIVRPFTFVKSVSGTRITLGQVVRPFTFVKDVVGRKTTFGQIVRPFTFVKDVVGRKTSFGQVVSPFTFTKSVVASKLTFGQVVRPFTFVKDVVGRRTAFGQIVRPFTFVKDVVGQRKTFGQVSAPFVFTKAVGGVSVFINRISATFTFTKSVSGTKKTFSQIAAPFTFTKAVSGTKKTFGQIVRPFTFARNVTGKLGAFSQIGSPFTFTKSVSGSKQTFAQVVRPFTFVKDVVGRKTTFGQTATTIVTTISTAGVRTLNQLYGVVSAPFIFVKDVAARRTTFGQVLIPLTFTKSVSGIRTSFGQVVRPFTFVKDVIGQRKTFGQVVRPFTFVKDVVGQRKTFGQVVRPFIFVKDVVGQKKTFGQIVSPFTFVKNVVGQRKTFGQIASPFTFVKIVSGTKKTFGQVVAPFTFVKNVGGIRTALGQVVRPFTFTKSVFGSKQTFAQVVRPFTFVKDVVGRKTTFGQIVSPFTFVKNVTGKLGAFSQIVRPFTFTKSVSGRKTTFSRVDLPLILTDQTSGRKQTFGRVGFPIDIAFNVIAEVKGIRFGQASMSLVFGKNVVGRKTTFGQIVSPFIFVKNVVGQRKTFGQVVRPFTFVKDVVGRKTTFGQIVRPFTFVKDVSGARKTFGQVIRPFTFVKNVVGARGTFGQIVAPYLFSRSSQGSRKTFAKFDLPLKFVKETVGKRKTFGSSAFPINASIVVAGTTSTNIYGQVALSLVLGEQTSGHRKTFGRVITPYSFAAEMNGKLEAFSSIDFPVDFVVDVNRGRVEAYSSLGLELILSLEAAGIIRPHDIILNLAKAIYLGSTSVDAVYTDSQKVWSK